MRFAGPSMKPTSMFDKSVRDLAAGQLPAVLANNLAIYELQKPFIEPLLRFCRLTNTALDTLFYDVGALASDLLAKGTTIDTGTSSNSGHARHPLQSLDLTADTNPSGSVIIVDAQLVPYVRKPFIEMGEFFDYANGPDGPGLHTVAITGVGSSAYGAVAFAWNVSTAIGEPVAAVVPGYGLADVIPQALGGWFGFEGYNAIQSATQSFLATFAPTLAMMGKELALSTPGRQMAPTGAPVFLHGSAGSDDIHAILQSVPGINRLVGHSKGALAIENALRSIETRRTKEISVVTFGCVIAQETQAQYTQYLGLIDTLGILNSAGHTPDFQPFAHHSTNTLIPFNTPVASLLGSHRDDCNVDDDAR
jgi:hypothetical protein